jgi:hypothetical protein
MSGSELIVLASGSHSSSGCDRITLDGGKIVVQGKARHGYPAGSGLTLPEDEVLNVIDPRILLEAADAYRARMTR